MIYIENTKVRTAKSEIYLGNMGLYVDGYLVSQHYVILAATVFQCVAGAVVARWIYGRVELHALLLWEKFRHKET